MEHPVGYLTRDRSVAPTDCTYLIGDDENLILPINLTGRLIDREKNCCSKRKPSRILRGRAFAIADAEFPEIAAWVIRPFAHAQTGDTEILLDVDVLNPARREHVRDLLIQERTNSRKVSDVGLLEMREGIFVANDFQYRNCHQFLVREDAGTDQRKMRLALQAALERLEFTLRLQIMRCISPGIPAPKQRLALLDG